MKKLPFLFLLILPFVSLPLRSQVGINTTSPQGILDMQNNPTNGLVYPRVPLNATNDPNPVVNPNGGALEPGTIVYNTSTTNTGSNDVYPGVYAWDGTEWTTQYIKEDIQEFEQSTLDFRVQYNTGYKDVPGLGNGSTFTPKYTGTYRVVANFNFAAGEIKPAGSGDDINMATQEGNFKFTFDGTTYDIYTHSYSAHNKQLNGGSGTGFDTFRHDSSLVLYEDLTAGTPYSFRLRLTVWVSNSNDFNNSDPDAWSHVGVDVPCTVEFTYLEGN